MIVTDRSAWGHSWLILIERAKFPTTGILDTESAGSTIRLSLASSPRLARRNAVLWKARERASERKRRQGCVRLAREGKATWLSHFSLTCIIRQNHPRIYNFCCQEPQLTETNYATHFSSYDLYLVSKYLSCCLFSVVLAFHAVGYITAHLFWPLHTRPRIHQSTYKPQEHPSSPVCPWHYGYRARRPWGRDPIGFWVSQMIGSISTRQMEIA